MKSKFKYHPLSSGPTHPPTGNHAARFIAFDLIHEVFISSPIKLLEECSGFKKNYLCGWLYSKERR